MKQLAGTAQNDITFHQVNGKDEAGVEIMLLIVEKEYYYQDGLMHSRMKSENVRFNLSLAAAKSLKEDIDEIVMKLEAKNNTPST